MTGKKPDKVQKAEKKKPDAVRTQAKKKQDKAQKPIRERRQLTTAEWRKIRIEYVKGKVTCRELAEKYHVASGTIRKHASKEGWTKKKRKLDAQVEQKAIARICDARAKEFEQLAAINDRATDALENMLAFIQAQPPKKYDDLRGVESLTKAIAQVVQIKRDLYNLPNEIEKAKIESLREKSKLERERFAEEQAEKAASKHAAENTMIRVVIDGDEDGEPLDE